MSTFDRRDEGVYLRDVTQVISVLTSTLLFLTPIFYPIEILPENFRFWLMHHFADTPLLGTAYTGPIFFDYVLTWLEFCPWFTILIAGHAWRCRLAPLE